MTSRNGFESIDIAQTAYTVWSSCSGAPVRWEDADQEAWSKLAERAIRAIDANIESQAEMSASELARTLFSWFSYDPSRERFSGIDPHMKATWEAVGRHLVNCLDSEPGSVTLSENEAKWQTWVSRRLEKQGVIS